MKASGKKGRKVVKRSIPWALHMAIIRLQGEEELEYDEACVKAAALIEEEGVRYREDVRAEANRIYKSRHMVELNKARNTWYRKGYGDGLADGRKDGIEVAETVYMIRYPCARCGGDVVLTRNGEDTRSAIEFLKSVGWGHKQCGETSKPRE
jgi:hypothetical protein